MATPRPKKMEEKPKSISSLVEEAIFAMNNGTRPPHPYKSPKKRNQPPVDISRFFIDINEDSGVDDWITPKPLNDEWKEEQIIFNVHRRDDILTPEGTVTKVNVTTSIAIKNCPEKQQEIDEWRALAETHKELLERTKRIELLEAKESEQSRLEKMRIRKAIIMRDPLAWHGRCTVKKGRQDSSNKKMKKSN